jgi:hypothetical protein
MRGVTCKLIALSRLSGALRRHPARDDDGKQATAGGQMHPGITMKEVRVSPSIAHLPQGAPVHDRIHPAVVVTRLERGIAEFPLGLGARVHVGPPYQPITHAVTRPVFPEALDLDDLGLAVGVNAAQQNESGSEGEDDSADRTHDDRGVVRW